MNRRSPSRATSMAVSTCPDDTASRTIRSYSSKSLDTAVGDRSTSSESVGKIMSADGGHIALGFNPAMQGAAKHGRCLSRIDSVEARFTSEKESTEWWSELTPTRFDPVALTFSGLRSSRSTSTEFLRLSGEAGRAPLQEK